MAVRFKRPDARLEMLGYSLLSGTLLGLPFLVPALWWLAYLALVPWAVLLTREEVRRSWLYFLAGALTFFVIGLSPFALFHWMVPLLLAVFYGPFLLPFAFFTRVIHKRFRLPLTLLVPMAWVAGEWLRLRFSIGQVHIFPLGSSQYARLPLIQVADLAGVFGVSFIVAAGSGAVADLLVNRKRLGRRTLWPVSLFPALVVVCLLYGWMRLGAGDYVDGPRLAIVQPNVTHYKDPARAKGIFAEQLEFTRREITPGTADLVALPENAIGQPIGDDPYYGEALAALAREQQAALVVGAFSRASVVPPRMYTSAYYVSETGELLARYHKLHLIPWAEYMPFDGLRRLSLAVYNAHYALATKLLGYTSYGVPGRELVLFSIEGGGAEYRFATPICFEISSGQFGREAAAKGADFLLNITSEGVFGPSIYMHMLAHSRLRAVENRVSVVRVGNNGISGIIDPDGQVRSLVRGNETGRLWLEAGSVVDRVPINSAGATFYTRFGDLFSYLCLSVSLLLSGVALLPSKRPSASSAPGI